MANHPIFGISKTDGNHRRRRREHSTHRKFTTYSSLFPLPISIASLTPRLRNDAHYAHLFSYFSQHTPHLPIPLPEPELRVLELTLFCKRFGERRSALKLMAREPREEVVCHLEVQPAVQEREGVGADNVGCGA